MATISRRRAMLSGLLLGLAAASFGCGNGEKSAQLALTHATRLGEIVDKDLGEVERGLPLGAGKSASVFYDAGNDPAKDPIAVRRGLNKVQVGVPDLLVAKSTFFALIDAKGIAIRNNLEVDAMAGMDLFALFPALKDVKPGEMKATIGTFPQAKDDKTWVAAAAIAKPANAGSGPAPGFLLTGWSFRYFAYHLQEALLSEVKTKLMTDKNEGKLPILYVAVFDADGVYVAPQTPAVNAQTLKDLNLVEKTKGGAAKGVLEITNRSFGYAAIRTPKMGPNVGVAVLRGEI